MSSRFSHTSRLTKLIIIIEFVLVAYLIYSLTRNFYRSYQYDQYITSFKEENARIAAENQKRNEDFLYYTSEEYIDKIAKQNLGLVNPGEEVIVLSDDVLDEEDISLEDEDFGNAAKYSKMSVREQWVNFFFKD